MTDLSSKKAVHIAYQFPNDPNSFPEVPTHAKIRELKYLIASKIPKHFDMKELNANYTTLNHGVKIEEAHIPIS